MGQVIRERKKLLVPSAVIGHALILALAGPLGIMPPLGVYTFDFVMLAVAIVIGALLLTGRIPERWMFLASAAVQWTGLASILASMYATNKQAYTLLLM